MYEMNKSISKVSNPLTIIAIFAGLAEINGTVVLALVPANIQEIFSWFIIAFPILLVVLFFATLNLNPKVIYAPSDFANEDNFMKTLSYSGKMFSSEQIEIVKDGKRKEEGIVLLEKEEWSNFGTELFPKETRLHLKYGNEFNEHLLSLLEKYMNQKVFMYFSFGIQAPEYFTINYSFNPEVFEAGERVGGPYTIIIRILRDEDGSLRMAALGKGIISDNPKEFSDKIFYYLERQKNHLGNLEKT